MMGSDISTCNRIILEKCKIFKKKNYKEVLSLPFPLPGIFKKVSLAVLVIILMIRKARTIITTPIINDCVFVSSMV